MFATDNQKLVNLVTKQEIKYSEYLIEEHILNNSLNLEGKKISVGLTPITIDYFLFEEMKSKLETLSQINEKVIRLNRSEEKVKKFFYKYSPYSYLFETPLLPSMISISRFDILINSTNDFKVLENNSCCPGGAFYKSEVKKAWLSTPIKNKLIEYEIYDERKDEGDLFIETLIKNYKTYKHTEKNPVVALVNINGIYTNELSLMVNKFTDLGINSFITDIRELEWDGEKLIYDQYQIDLVYHKFSPSMFLEHIHEMSDYLSAYNSGKVCCINSLDAIFITEDKSTLALLTDPLFKKYFSKDEIEVINAHIPWTRRLIPGETTGKYGENILNLLQYCLDNKNNLVIKPANKTRGQEVIFGKDLNEAEWEQLLNNCWKNDYVIQDFVPLPTIQIPNYVDESDEVIWEDYFYGIETYMFNNKFEFITSRASTIEVVNIGKKGKILPCFLIKEKDGL